MPSCESRMHISEGRRRTARETVTLAGSALAITESRSIVVADLSAHGAKLRGRALPAAGTEVLIVVGPLDAFARISWRSRDECGVCFDDPLDANQLAEIKQEGRWAHVMVSRLDLRKSSRSGHSCGL